MNAFELLKADHKKVAQLFDRLDAAKGNAKLPIFQQIKKELEIHTYIEETVFYPALEKPEETHDLTLEAYEEHKVVKTLLAELASAKSADDEWQAKAKVLRENVEHHVDEEENELFDEADDALSDEQIESLGERMETAKAKKLGKTLPDSSGEKNKFPKAGASETGILSMIANFVGIGSAKGADSKKSAAKKRGSRSGGTSNKVTRKTAGKKSVKVVSKTRLNSKAGKRSAVSQEAKKSSRKKAGRK